MSQFVNFITQSKIKVSLIVIFFVVISLSSNFFIQNTDQIPERQNSNSFFYTASLVLKEYSLFGIFGALIVHLLVRFNEWRTNRKKEIRLKKLLYHELDDILKTIKRGKDSTDAKSFIHSYFSTESYNVLVNSGEIRILDLSVQLYVQIIYHKIKLHNTFLDKLNDLDLHTSIESESYNRKRGNLIKFLSDLDKEIAKLIGATKKLLLINEKKEIS